MGGSMGRHHHHHGYHGHRRWSSSSSLSSASDIDTVYRKHYYPTNEPPMLYGAPPIGPPPPTILHVPPQQPPHPPPPPPIILPAPAPPPPPPPQPTIVLQAPPQPPPPPQPQQVFVMPRSYSNPNLYNYDCEPNHSEINDHMDNIIQQRFYRHENPDRKYDSITQQMVFGDADENVKGMGDIDIKMAVVHSGDRHWKTDTWKTNTWKKSHGHGKEGEARLYRPAEDVDDEVRSNYEMRWHEVGTAVSHKRGPDFVLGPAHNRMSGRAHSTGSIARMDFGDDVMDGGTIRSRKNNGKRATFREEYHELKDTDATDAPLRHDLHIRKPQNNVPIYDTHIMYDRHIPRPVYASHSFDDILHKHDHHNHLDNHHWSGHDAHALSHHDHVRRRPDSSDGHSSNDSVHSSEIDAIYYGYPGNTTTRTPKVIMAQPAQYGGYGGYNGYNYGTYGGNYGGNYGGGANYYGTGNDTVYHRHRDHFPSHEHFY